MLHIPLLLLASLFLLSSSAHASEFKTSQQPREAILAGGWYPKDPEKLQSSIEGYLHRAHPDRLKGRLVALISPHAGHMYSGAVAAHAYKLLQQHPFDSVVIIAPSHHAAFDGVSVYDQGPYKTPLGEISLDDAFIKKLKTFSPRIKYVKDAHAKEHSLEIQLPFLQTALPNAKLIPLVMGSQNEQTCRMLSNALVKTIKASKNTVLLLASTDLSHFFPRNTAKEMDRNVIDAVKNFSLAELTACISDESCQACGAGPLYAVMQAALALGANSSQVLKYADSGDVSGDTSSVVGYLAAALTHVEKPHHTREKAMTTTQQKPEYTQAERDLLLAIAADSIKAALDGSKYSPPGDLPPKLMKKRAAFVTLNKHGALRGCIGHVIARAPLARTVADMARAAAFQDPRFPKLQRHEFDDLEFEISVLTPMRMISSPEEIQVGVHGVMIQKGFRSGLLLPQVPTEYGWDRTTFLQQTCRKAGLQPDCWKDSGARIEIFSAEVFSSE